MPAGADVADCWGSVPASRKAMQRSGRLVFPTVLGIQRSARYAISPRDYAPRPDGQILIGQRVAVAVEETITLEEVGALTLKGLTQPVLAYNAPLAAIQPALRVIEGGPQRESRDMKI